MSLFINFTSLPVFILFVVVFICCFIDFIYNLRF